MPLVDFLGHQRVFDRRGHDFFHVFQKIDPFITHINPCHDLSGRRAIYQPGRYGPFIVENFKKVESLLFIQQTQGSIFSFDQQFRF